ncbi:MAG TPA: hypothetical protein VMV20_06830 [Chitinophagaceae bacterium]|nr:hypothetical protein [Chitinophagaceae bacterium]
MEEQQFTAEDGLRVIREMISKTKEDLTYDSFYLLLWGWLVISICLLQFILLEYFKWPYHYLAWTLIWIGIIASIIRAITEKRRERVRTYVGDALKYIWLGMFAAFIILGSVCGILQLWQACFPLYIILYGLGTFISGGLIRFRPLMIGGTACWVLAIVAALVPYDVQIVLGAVAILVSYVIPGHMLRYRQIQRHKLSQAS